MTKRSYLAAESVSRTIYLIGGYKVTPDGSAARGRQVLCKEVSKELIAYCPENNTSENAGQLNQARASFRSANLYQLIFVVGGTGMDGSNISSTEFFQQDSKKLQKPVWNIVTSGNLVNQVYDFLELRLCLCIVDDEIFVFDSRLRTLFRKKLFKERLWFIENKNVPKMEN